MTLGEVLKGKTQIRIKEYERLGDKLYFIGGCYYADGIYIHIDGGFYSKCVKLNAYEWKDNNTLMIVREKDDDNKDIGNSGNGR